MKTALNLFIINLILFGNSLRKNFTKQTTQNHDLRTIYYDNRNQSNTEILKYISSGANLRIIVENSFVYSKKSLKVNTLPEKKILFCVADFFYNQQSNHECSFNKNLIIDPKSSIFFVFRVKNPNQDFLNVSFIHLNNISNSVQHKNKTFLPSTYLSRDSIIQLKLTGTTLNDGINYVIGRSKFSERLFIPAIPTFLGLLFISPILCNFNIKSDSYECTVPPSNSIYLGYIDFEKLVKRFKAFEHCVAAAFIYISSIILTKTIYFISSSESLLYMRQSLHYIDVQLNSLFFGFALCLNILSSYYCINTSLANISTFAINFFWIGIVNSLFKISLNIIFECRYIIVSLKDSLSRGLLIQDTIYAVLAFFSILVCFFINQNTIDHNVHNRYTIHIDAIKNLVFPTFSMVFILCIFFFILAGLSIYNLYVKKIRFYKFSTYSYSPDIHIKFRSLIFSITSLVAISVSVLSYILSSQVYWVHESTICLISSFFTFVLHILTASFVVNRKPYQIIGDTSSNPSISINSPASVFQERNIFHGYELGHFCKEKNNQEDHGVIQVAKPPPINETSHYYESFIELVPVFQLSPINNIFSSTKALDSDLIEPIVNLSLVSETPWKSSGISALEPESSCHRSLSCDENETSSIYELTSDHVSSTSHLSSTTQHISSKTQLTYLSNFQFSDFGINEESKVNDYIFQTPQSTAKLQRKYPRTPFKIICQNRTNSNSDPIYKIDYDDLESSS